MLPWPGRPSQQAPDDAEARIRHDISPNRESEPLRWDRFDTTLARRRVFRYMRRPMRLSDFDFNLPEELIAQEPLSERDASRLLVVPLDGGRFQHRHVRDLPDLLAPGDLLVFNDARVIPARLRGRKADTGGRVELLLVEPLPTSRVGAGRTQEMVESPGKGEPEASVSGGGERWYCLGQASKGLRPGQGLEFGSGLWGTVEGPGGDGGVIVRLSESGDALLQRLWDAGEIPLPPYIRSPHRPAAADPNADRYQTIFARRPGASAAPTAGLHFTPRLLEALKANGVETATVTLLVGPGTFLPVRTEDLSEHRMHEERYEIPEETAKAIARTKEAEGRVIAVGTTSLRAVEAAWAGNETEEGTSGSGSPSFAGVRVGAGSTDLFLLPGSSFHVVDGLVTNFHLPKSTLLMLVAALAGRERILEAYSEAVNERYRFFSYGDAMLLV